MADKKTTVKTKKENTNKKSTAKRSSVKHDVKKPVEKLISGKRPPYIYDKIFPFVIITVGAFLALCFLFPGACGVVGRSVRDAIFGTFGAGSIPIPFFMIALGLFYLKLIDPVGKYPRKKIYIRIAFGAISVLTLSSFLSVVFFGTDAEMTAALMFEKGKSFLGGGVIGGSLAKFLCKYIGVFSVFLLFLVTFVCGILAFGLTPYKLYDIIKEKRNSAKDEDDEFEGFDPDDIRNSFNYSDEECEPIPIKAKKNKKTQPITDSEKKHKDPFDHSLESCDIEKEDDTPIDNSRRIDLEDNSGKKISFAHSTKKTEEEKKSAFDYEKHNREKKEEKTEKAPVKEKNPDADFDLEKIFTDASYSTVPMNEEEKKEDTKEMEVEKTTIGTPPEEMPKPDAPVYRLPPMSLLKLDTSQQSADVTSELEKNSKKLISTLASFNVDANVVHISRGPTITRYELKLAPGIRVTAISKLVDDIAMAFASTGVRIEAPIPGKDAVGVEVPNKDIRIVRIRELIDADYFKKSESKLTCALGVDVVGEPVYLDIAKMPHMLVAGATGMGKSVCINSLLISLLCKASPNDVKIMLIDPKKVEFVPYSGIPHLIVPVVTDPKKAAGALHWAVEEMERRYSLIESVGCRNIFGYNEATANDPEKEHLSQMVIVIDELADLMMTAKNDVETSICRIAQKARAAGMHLIVGTQRPSVDIVTGSIKANIPSRIACKTSSQVDSRTIIDIAGAEKLIGRGDMLFAPVGISKPRRLQGAFVSDSEVEAVTSFIKKTYGKVEYDEGVKEKIEREAQQLSSGKQSFFDDADGSEEEDEMLRPAIEFAFESGKVSTSLFQRKLSIGYGRAAKIIDRMEELGICSAASGNKPRELLISKEQYYEMVEGDN